MLQPKGSVSGGSKLRLLRESRKLSQFELELIGSITQANYSKIERGVSSPSKEKLEDILVALKASFNETQDILKSFGFSIPYPLPSDEEMESVRMRCQPILDRLPLPAYTVDLITRLVAWNGIFTRLAGENADMVAQLKGVPLFKAQFSSRVRLQSFMDDIDGVLLDDVRMIRSRLEPYQDEQWYSDFLEELREEPVFQQYWDRAESLGSPAPEPFTFATRILHPVRFKLPQASDIALTFYSNPEPLQDDSRFQMIYLVPADLFTQRQVDRWRDEAPLLDEE
jgi:transcriptional regulator with XRE-family HTH domain